tara:strand:+ start:345 stop:578 length:234 start_codon:yes stop_codon:yes gene_type:complete
VEQVVQVQQHILQEVQFLMLEVEVVVLAVVQQEAEQLLAVVQEVKVLLQEQQGQLTPAVEAVEEHLILLKVQLVVQE